MRASSGATTARRNRLRICARPTRSASLPLRLAAAATVHKQRRAPTLEVCDLQERCFASRVPIKHSSTAWPAGDGGARACRKAVEKKEGKKDKGSKIASLRAPIAAARAALGGKLPKDVALFGVLGIAGLLTFYIFHCVWVSAEMYSAPSIVLQTKQQDGSLMVFDDFREAYAWLRYNTAEDCKVASWWDYGYQTTAMANRTVIVDNNTWNNTHIATVGLAMASPEKKAWKIYRSLDVEYVFVVFGGFIGYPSDDINKFLWMVRIGGGEFPEIKEKDYIGSVGYSVDKNAAPAMLDSLMYKLSYYQFADAGAMAFGRRGWDRVRNYEIGKTEIKLKYFEEVFTTEHWMVRIFRVKDPVPREPKHSNAHRIKLTQKSKVKARHPSGEAS